MGRQNGGSGKVRLSKGIAGGSGVEVDLDELRRRVEEARGIAGPETSLRGLCSAVVLQTRLTAARQTAIRPTPEPEARPEMAPPERPFLAHS